MNKTWIYRRAQDADLCGILDIQQEAYAPSLHEDGRIIAERLRAAAGNCWVVQDEAGLAAYLFTYASLPGSVTPLGGRFPVAANGNTLYVHDLAVAKRASGFGLGAHLLALATANALASGFRFSALVAVQGSQPFWERHGYRPHEALNETNETHLQSYPGAALYMTRSLDG